MVKLKLPAHVSYRCKSSSMSHSILKKLLRKYLKRSANRAERFIVDTWYSSFRELGDLTPGIETEEKSAEKEEKMFNKIMTGKKTIKLWYQRAEFKIAASLLIVTSVSLIFYTRNNNKQSTDSMIVYHTKKGETKKVILPDSTTVWLNAATDLKVAARYGKDFRKVDLHGEAYFEVKHNTAVPFIISTGKLRTQVLGTSFNVSAYDGLNLIDVLVRTGKVSVSDERKLLGTLTPGKAIHFDKQKLAATISTEDAEIGTDWRNGKTMLNRVTFEELAERFDNIFNARLFTKDKNIRKLQFRLILDKSVPLQENLNVITDIHQLKYRKINEHEIELYTE